jgi:hypothetical protein
MIILGKCFTCNETAESHSALFALKSKEQLMAGLCSGKHFEFEYQIGGK